MDGDGDNIMEFLLRVVAQSQANETLNHPGPWLVVSQDPMMEGFDSMGFVGPFDDHINAMIAAQKWQDDLNVDLTEGDPPWSTHVVPLWSGDEWLKGENDE